MSTVSTDFPKLALSLAEGDDEVGSDDGDMTTTFMEIHMGVSLNGGTPKTPQNDDF